MARRRRLNRGKRVLIAAAAYAAYSKGASSRPRKRVGFSGWSLKAKLGYWGVIEEPSGK